MANMFVICFQGHLHKRGCDPSTPLLHRSPAELEAQCSGTAEKKNLILLQLREQLQPPVGRGGHYLLLDQPLKANTVHLRRGNLIFAATPYAGLFKWFLPGFVLMLFSVLVFSSAPAYIYTNKNQKERVLGARSSYKFPMHLWPLRHPSYMDRALKPG